MHVAIQHMQAPPTLCFHTYIRKTFFAFSLLANVYIFCLEQERFSLLGGKRNWDKFMVWKSFFPVDSRRRSRTKRYSGGIGCLALVGMNRSRQLNRQRHAEWMHGGDGVLHEALGSVKFVYGLAKLKSVSTAVGIKSLVLNWKCMPKLALAEIQRLHEALEIAIWCDGPTTWKRMYNNHTLVALTNSNLTIHHSIACNAEATAANAPTFQFPC